MNTIWHDVLWGFAAAALIPAEMYAAHEVQREMPEQRGLPLEVPAGIIISMPVRANRNDGIAADGLFRLKGFAA
jgi:hypothetical protein